MTATAITVFDFEEQPIRTVDQNGEPWFLLTDLCRALGISNPAQVAARLDEDERSMFNIGRQGEAVIVSESGMYSTILRSRGAATKGTPAHRFRRWVTGEVLPALRKKGAYGQTNQRTFQHVRAVKALQDQYLKLIDKLVVTRDAGRRQVIYNLVVTIADQLGTVTPSLSDLGEEAPLVPHVLDRFFSLVTQLEDSGYQINHHRVAGMLALNLVEVRETLKREGIPFDARGQEFTKALRTSTSPRFIKNTAVNSRLTGHAKSCWVFAIEPA